MPTVRAPKPGERLTWKPKHSARTPAAPAAAPAAPTPDYTAEQRERFVPSAKTAVRPLPSDPDDAAHALLYRAEQWRGRSSK